MGTNISRGFVLLVIATVISSANCKKNLNCAETVYSFEINDIKIYPNQDSIQIADTVWLDINLPVQLKDITTGANIDYSGAENLGIVTHLIELLGNNNYRGAISDFSLKLEDGTNVPNFIDTSSLKEYLFNEVNGIYLFRLGFIARKKGIFRISFDNVANVYRKNDKCTKAGFSLMLDQTNSHSYYNDNNFPGIVTDSLRLYCFKVK